MADLSKRMWDLSDFLVTTVGGVQQLSDSIQDRNHDHAVIATAIRSQNPDVARAAMESHIVGTVAAFSARLDATS
jgi:DNA-binding FadR family transcriptional regulator